MRKVTLLFLALALSATSLHAQNGSLTKVEKLTDQQKQSLAAAQAKVEQAQAELHKVEAQIAAEHQCKSELWMEWSSTCTIEGDFLLQRYYGMRYSTEVK